ncbi:hypothetical protein AVEN_30357-1 [Araneus ventricosus]|uniref:Uncharacterized protein n=1 Tax=Araneus ventricosus TaxID=182803 RepID=A0A4Y2MXH5_ARAVE|nr:hypothetical protein AVEN_30357-1 [Araneus ventricosus]
MYNIKLLLTQRELPGLRTKCAQNYTPHDYETFPITPRLQSINSSISESQHKQEKNEGERKSFKSFDRTKEPALSFPNERAYSFVPKRKGLFRSFANDLKRTGQNDERTTLSRIFQLNGFSHHYHKPFPDSVWIFMFALVINKDYS